MTRKKIGLAIATTALTGALVVGGTLAYFTDNDSASNVFTMGKVDIDVVESSDDDKMTNITEEGITYDNVVPGDEIEKIADVTVDEDSENAYIRVAIEAVSDDASLSEHMKELTNNIKAQVAATENWSLGDDGYLYYAPIVKASEKINIFKTVTIPKTWGNEIAGKEFKINITAYAVQADNFDNDWTQLDFD